MATGRDCSHLLHRRDLAERLLAEQVWANNQSGDSGDSAADIRVFRDEDRRAVDARWERMEIDGRSDARSDENVITDLRNSLGLNS